MDLMERILVLIALIFITGTGVILQGSCHQSRGFPSSNDDNNEEPLILTPFIQKGQIKQARTQSRVPSVMGMNLESYSGFFTVRPDADANLFFWFFPALNDSAHKPIVLWMNGGPGLTSLSGNFAEIGPYYITTDGQVNRRNVTWVSQFNVLFIDTPVGTGFSYAKSVEFYTNTTSLIAQDLVVALKQFFQVFSEFSNNDFYVTGESYASKYAIVVADIITTNKVIGANFKGIILVSGMFSPGQMVKPAEYLYQDGMIDKKLMSTISTFEGVFSMLVKVRFYTLASKMMALLIGGGGTSAGGNAYHPSFFTADSGIVSSDNILYDNEPTTFITYTPFVNSTPVRQALHVGSLQFNDFPPIILEGITETGDLATPFTDQLQNVLNRGYKTILISGNMDYLVPTAGMTDTINSLEWNYANQYAQTTRTVWKVNTNDLNTAGYVTCAVNFCFAIVRNAGHRLPGDEPLRALTVVERFINNKPFNVSNGV